MPGRRKCQCFALDCAPISPGVLDPVLHPVAECAFREKTVGRHAQQLILVVLENLPEDEQAKILRTPVLYNWAVATFWTECGLRGVFGCVSGILKFFPENVGEFNDVLRNELDCEGVTRIHCVLASYWSILSTETILFVIDSTIAYLGGSAI